MQAKELKTHSFVSCEVKKAKKEIFVFISCNLLKNQKTRSDFLEDKKCKKT